MYKRLMLAAAIAAATVSASADTVVMDLARQAEDIQSNPGRLVDSAWLKEVASKGNPFATEAHAVTSPMVSKTLEQMTPEERAEQDKAVMAGYKYLIFASFSLGEEGLKDVFIAASGRADTAVVFRGVAEGERIDEAMYRIQAIAKMVEPIPNVMLQPSLFREYNVTVAPTLVMRGEDGKAIASVRGLYRPDWIAEQVENNKSGDLGFLGPAELIAERDLVEVMMERAQAIDWEEKKQNAVKRAWNNTYMAKLPPADIDRERKVPATVMVTKDIVTPDGQVVARAGDAINPLKVRPFTTAYIVFNPNRRGEIDFALQLKQRILQQGQYKQVALMFTELDVGEDGWQSYKDLTDRLDAHVFTLTQDVQQRFAIEKTPSLVTADDENFVVKEFQVVQGLPAVAASLPASQTMQEAARD